MVLLTGRTHSPMSHKKCYWPCKHAWPST